LRKIAKHLGFDDAVRLFLETFEEGKARDGKLALSAER